MIDAHPTQRAAAKCAADPEMLRRARERYPQVERLHAADRVVVGFDAYCAHWCIVAPYGRIVPR